MRIATAASLLFFLLATASLCWADATTRPTTQVTVPPAKPTVVAFHQAVIEIDQPALARLIRADSPASLTWRDTMIQYFMAKAQLAKSADSKLGGMKRLVMADEYFVLDRLDDLAPSVVMPLMIVTLPEDRGTLVLRLIGQQWFVDFESAASLGMMTPDQIRQQQDRFATLTARYIELTKRVEAGEFTRANAFMSAFNTVHANQ
jgi:hypothetical protein